MSYTAAITEIRQMLADTAFHKKATKKKIIGDIDGTNVDFTTYDKRLVDTTVLVYVNNVSVSFSLVDAIKGELQLDVPPGVNTKVAASYYWTFWIDDEIKTFLNKGAESTGQFSADIPDDAYLQIQQGLKQAALKFACSLAIRSLIQYMTNRRHSAEYNLEQDGNDDKGFSMMIESMSKQADSYWKEAIFHRDDFYKRLGKRNAPAFGVKTVQTRKYGAFR